jgi:hypothetical protein
MRSRGRHEAETPARRDSLPGIYQQLQGFSDTLGALSAHWPSARPVALWWDEDRRVLATDAAAGTYRAIYGNVAVRGLARAGECFRRRQRGQPYRRCREPLRIRAPLPPDAVAKPQLTADRGGHLYVLTVVSDQEQCVAKIFARERKAHFDNEIEAWRLARAAGISHRLPEIISSEESVNEFSCLVSRLVRNNGLFYPPPVGDWLWRRHLLTQVLPELQRFYERSGVEVLSGREWLDRLRAQTADHPMSAPLQDFLRLVEDAREGAGDDRVPFAVVHGDLVSPNVHRYDGRWWLIDWSYSRRLPVTVDLWRGLWRFLAGEAFGAWLRGHASLSALPRGARAHLEMYAGWLDAWMGIRPDACALRFEVLATLLHRLTRNRWSGQTPLSIETFRVLGIHQP